MEQNEITIAVDVKLDLKERRGEFHQFRKWNKCLVRIEAIKCFPCYVKVTFINSNDRDSSENVHSNTNQVVNINLPGLSVGLATSRTQNHAYGLFWKNNRKNCCIYLAFDNQQSCDRHLKWLRKSIKNLELHRREILETRRNSRFGLNKMEESSARSLDSSLCELRNATSNIKDLKDILGPLPEPPDAMTNWSRRISGFSGIYEEIVDNGDGGVTTRNSCRRMSRASIASGIYEVMRPPLCSITEVVASTPPPLPPRKRSNTNQKSGFQRSYTNPESDMYKKRNIFFEFLSKHKRSGSNGSQAHTGGSSKADENTPAFELVSHARNSFSSPDLMLPHKDDNTSSSSDDCVDIDLVDGNFSILSSSSFLDSGSVVSADISENPVEEEVAAGPHIPLPSEISHCSVDMNISEKIMSTYNISCNMSSINLVGANVVPTVTTAQLEDHSSGYCRMMPIFADIVNKNEHTVPIPVIQPKTATVESEGITFDRGDNVLDGIRMLSICTTPESRHSHSSTENIKPAEQQELPATPTETIYSNITTNDNPLAPHNSQSSRKRLKAKNIFLCSRSSPNQSSNDEKYPSYYPNMSPTTPDSPTVLTTKKSPIISLVNHHHYQTPRKENVHIATPHTKSSRKSPAQKSPILTNKVQTKSRYRGSTPTSANKAVVPNASRIRNISIEIEPDTNNRHSNRNSLILTKEPDGDDGCDAADEDEAQTPNRLYRKYGTPVRCAVSENIVTPIDDIGSTGLAASLKQFRTLPRFRGIDFSPLKIRINNVLQRYNSYIV